MPVYFMDAFEKLVKYCRENDKDILIDNAAWEHALFLFYNMLDIAIERKASVRIVTGSMNGDFFCEKGIVDRVQQLIANCTSIHVLVVNNPSFDVDKHPCAKRINDYEHGRVLVAQSPVPVPHMLLIGDDAKCFRYETDHEQTKAVASFNNAEMGSSMNSLYELAMASVENPTPLEEQAAA